MNRSTFQLSFAAAALVAAMATAQAQMPAPHAVAPGTAQTTPMPMPPAQPGMPMPGPMAPGSQPAPMGDMGRMMEMMGPMMAQHRGMGMAFEHVEGRIAYLKAELKITDAQSAPWNAFAETMRADATAMKTMRDGMMQGAMPTTMPDRMAAQHKMMSARLTMMDRSAASTKALYEALSVDQRKALDEMTQGPMGMM